MITIKSEYNNIFFSNKSFMIFYVLRRLDVSTSFAMFLYVQMRRKFHLQISCMRWAAPSASLE